MLRKHYWIPQARSLVSSVIRPCVIPKKVEGRPYQYPIQPTLPDFCTSSCFSAFEYTGVDIFGPLHYLSETKETLKIYSCLFTCHVTCAVHLELMMKLSVSQFSYAVQRFLNRRGKTKMFYSDNGSCIKAFEQLHQSEYN